MNRPALRIDNDVERKIHSLEQRVDALKQQITQSNARRREDAGRETEVRAVIEARRTREALIGADLFADPAWDMLLELYAASLGQRRMSVSDLASLSAVPTTTALRWIGKLESAGLLRRSDDPLDGRRVWVEISVEGEEKMRGCLDAIRSRLSLI